MVEVLKAILLGIVQGITEWLPISSTGHMIILDEFIHLDVSDAFKEVFLVVVQLGSILAVVILFWKKIWPFYMRQKNDGKKSVAVDMPIIHMWLKIVVASIPAAIVGLLFDDVFTALFYNYQTVAIMLILFGVIFIVVENYNKTRTPKVNSIAEISYRTAFVIGIFQMIAAVFPGTSRSGATIVGALLLGVSRVTAAEFTFFLAIPAMFGGSAVKLVKHGFAFTSYELVILLAGTIVAFVTSIFVIKFLMSYIKKHDFKVFGWYRIVLGCIVLLYFLLPIGR